MRQSVTSLGALSVLVVGGFFGAGTASAVPPVLEPTPAPTATARPSPAGALPFPSFPTSPSFLAFPTPSPFPSFPFPSAPYPTATLADGTLTVTGGAGDDIISIFPRDIVTNPASQVRGGTTSVGLDLALLERAAGLKLTGASTPGRPASADFLVGFPILPSTDFRYRYPQFAPVSGLIRHTGTVTFNESVTIGTSTSGSTPPALPAAAADSSSRAPRA